MFGIVGSLKFLFIVWQEEKYIKERGIVVIGEFAKEKVKIARR